MHSKIRCVTVCLAWYITDGELCLVDICLDTTMKYQEKVDKLMRSFNKYATRK